MSLGRLLLGSRVCFSRLREKSLWGREEVFEEETCLVEVDVVDQGGCGRALRCGCGMRDGSVEVTTTEEVLGGSWPSRR